MRAKVPTNRSKVLTARGYPPILASAASESLPGHKAFTVNPLAARRDTTPQALMWK